MDYRREVDGLRALAVIPVILFHAGFKAFSGGFVGVDVFFVISGYLITTIILAELESGKFSIVNFYERRARRILPALFLVMAACLPFAWLWLLPNDMKDFSNSVIAVSIFASNIQFWRESGYFDTTAELKPLLHTWSLAVEEQFYVFFPVLLMLTWRLGKKWVIGLISVVALASLTLAHWGALNKPSAAFFLLPTRGWELAIGSLAAFYFANKQRKEFPHHANQLLSIMGLCLILFSIFVYSEKTPFPSFYTLVPTVGAVLIILFAWPETFAGRLLGSKAFVGTGLISYSAYLWHQPLFVFIRHRSIEQPDPVSFSVLAVLTLVLAYLSWRFVEIPFRNKNSFRRKSIFCFATVGSLLFIAFGLYGNFSAGYRSRFPAAIYPIVDAPKDINPRRGTCHAGPKNPIQPESACVLGKRDNVVGALLGDSHADAIAHSMEHALQESGVGVTNLTYNGCPPVQGLYRVSKEDRCDDHYRAAYEHIEKTNSYKYLIFVSRWSFFVNGERFNNQEGGVEEGEPSHFDEVRDGIRVRNSDSDRRKAVLSRYKATIQDQLRRGKIVILIYPIPEVGWNVPRLLYHKMRYENIKDPQVTTDYGVFKQRNYDVIETFDSIGDQKNLYRVRPDAIFCDKQIQGRCVTVIEGRVLYSDDDHLSNTGARFLVKEIMKAIEATQEN